MNNFLKHNLEMPLTGGYGGSAGGVSKPTLLGDGLQPGDTVMSITGADKNGNFLTNKNFVERNIDRKITGNSYPDLNGILETSGAQKTLSEGLFDSVELSNHKIAIPVRYNNSFNPEKVFVVFDNLNLTIDQYTLNDGFLNLFYQASVPGTQILDDLGNPEIAENIHFDTFLQEDYIQIVFYSNRSNSTTFIKLYTQNGDYHSAASYSQLPFNPKGIWLRQADRDFYVMNDGGDVYRGDFISGTLQLSGVLFSPSVDLNEVNLTSNFSIARDRNGLFQNSCQLVDNDRLFISFYKFQDNGAGETLFDLKMTSIYLMNDGYATCYFEGSSFESLVLNNSGVSQTFNAVINGNEVYPGGMIIPDGGFIDITTFLMDVSMNIPDVYTDEFSLFPMIQSVTDSFLEIDWQNTEGGLTSNFVNFSSNFYISSFLPSDFNNISNVILQGLNTDKTFTAEIEANRNRYYSWENYENEKLSSVYFRVDDNTSGNLLSKIDVLKKSDSYQTLSYVNGNDIRKFSTSFQNPFDDRLSLMFTLNNDNISNLSSSKYNGFYNYYHNGEFNEIILDVSEAGGETNYIRVKFTKNHKDIITGDNSDYFQLSNYEYIDTGIFENNPFNPIWFDLGVYRGVYNYMTFKNISPQDPKKYMSENGFILNSYSGIFANESFEDQSNYYPEQAVIFYNEGLFIMPKLNNGIDRYFTKHTYD